MAIKNSYAHTKKACYMAFITQAIVCNFQALLFTTFNKSYGIPMTSITLLVTVTFAVQIGVDLLSTMFVDRIGYRASIMLAQGLCAAGFVSMAVLPNALPSPYAGLMTAAVLQGSGCALIEVLISPLINACPSDNKVRAMSLLHSIYCIGSVCVILLSTVFFTALGTESWPVLTLIWAVISIADILYFSKVPIPAMNRAGEGMKLKELFRMGMFWIFVVLMLCAGSAEQGLAQWVSTFAETGLNLPKSIGDLAGPCMFVAMMGLARIIHSRRSHKVELLGYMIKSAALLAIGYLLTSLAPWPVLSLLGSALCGFAVGVMWPGIYSYVAMVVPRGGTAMFAMLALSGNAGCSLGPTIVGMVSGAFGGNFKIGLLVASIFPVLMLTGFLICRKFGRDMSVQEAKTGNMSN